MSKTETQSDALSAERRLFITAVANLELRKKFGDEGFRLDLERDELEALIEMAERVSRLNAENKALRARLEEQAFVPPGFALVPVEPTKEMVAAACRDHGYPGGSRSAYVLGYRSMLAAAPQAPTAPSEGLAADVEALLTLLEGHEWAEHCTKTPLGQRLEAAITELHNEIHAAKENNDVADTLLKRATELHEKGFMPWVEAEELALSEIGIEEAAIDELIGECTQRAFDDDFFLTGVDEVRAFMRAALVHQGMLHSGLYFALAEAPQAAAKTGDAA